MTPIELELFRNSAKITALETFLASWICATIRTPADQQRLLDHLERFAAEWTEQLRFRQASAEQSDLLSQETREAFESFASFMASRISDIDFGKTS